MVNLEIGAVCGSGQFRHLLGWSCAPSSLPFCSTAGSALLGLPGGTLSPEHCALSELSFVVDSCRQHENFGILLTGSGKLVVLKRDVNGKNNAAVHVSSVGPLLCVKNRSVPSETEVCFQAKFYARFEKQDLLLRAGV